MLQTVLIALAGLMGAGGVALSAAAAHAAAGANLATAGSILLLHAAALVGTIAVVHQGLVARPVGLAAAIGFAIGAALFSGDLALRAFAGTRLFPMAAPTGGTILMASWLMLAIAAVASAWRGA